MIRMRPIEAAAVIAGLALATTSGPPPAVAASRAEGAVSRPAPVAPRGRLPLVFEENRGQTDPRVRFLSRAPGMTAFFTPDETVLALHAGAAADRPVDDVVRMRFAGGESSLIDASDELPGRSHYFIGNDPSKWVTDVPQFAAVRARGVRPGVDLRWRTGDDGRLTYDLVVSPGARVADLAFELDGARDVEVALDGSLRAATEHGELRHGRPVAFQTIDGMRRAIDAAFVVEGTCVRFSVGPYDADRPLVIDPPLSYSSFLGGTNQDGGTGVHVAVDGSGASWVSGTTNSVDFPTQSPVQFANGGSFDGFVSKFNAVGTALVYSTYVGGSYTDPCYSVAVDGTGAACLAGYTQSANFPTASAFQGALSGAAGGSSDAYLLKLNAAGNGIVFSTYLGGTSEDRGLAVAVDLSGAAYLAGWTQSSDYPTQSPFQASLSGTQSPIVAKFSASGSLVYSTYLGAGFANAIAVDTAGAAYIAGTTSSTTFPTQSPLQASYGGGAQDAFVAKLNSSGAALVYSTYLGGSLLEFGYGIAVDSSGAAYVTGVTQSSDFPTASAYQSAIGGANDAYLAKINASGTALVYSTFLGTSGTDVANSVAVDSQGAVTIVGWTSASNFPVSSPAQPTYGGGPRDAYVSKFDATGSQLVFSTFLGGSGIDEATSVAVDGSGALYVVGYTRSSNFPTQSPLQASFAGGTQDCFLSKYGTTTGGGGGGAPPNPPTDLTATYDAVTGVTLAWAHPSTIQDGFLIERKPGNYSFAALGTTDGNTKTYTDKALFPGATYVYHVRAFSYTNGTSPWSNEASVTVPSDAPSPAPPTAPSGLTAESLPEGGIALSWTDQSPDEVFFALARAEGGDSFRDLVNLPANTTVAVDDAVHPGWPYTYRVRALSLQGPSSWSNDATATAAPTIDVAVTSGSLVDSSKSKHDALKIAATYGLEAGAFSATLDPVADGLELQLGFVGAPIRISIPANDPGWKVKTSRAKKGKPATPLAATWKSAKGASPKTTIVVDLVKRTITATLSSFDFAAAPTASVRLLMACGADGGGRSDAWTEGKPGAFKFKASK